MDNNYWEIGNFIGNAFNIGKNIEATKTTH
ncbi:hypothetical protein CPR_0881 [Clostridium perfringens SM101]|uniref:Uncharacterized protein n=3 Tax=Clostridium perfringens TaxID=1502 RepID=Q0SUK0_CLOPS|nr:hypothetical protein CPR_0881 [Clostridium perfringens SM101]